MTQGTTQQSNPFSTGGGGPNFEVRVQAAFAVLMLAGGNAPCLPPWPIQRIKLQGKYAGYDTDDCIIFAKDPNTEKEARLLAQIKHSISITEGNETFSEVIKAAWSDFNNLDAFMTGRDVLALISGPLSFTDINDVRSLLEWARYSENSREFIEKVKRERFSSDSKRKKLEAFQVHLKKANGGKDISDEELWQFLKSYHLIGYDLDTESGVTLSLLQSIIAQCSDGNTSFIWSKIVDTVQTANQNAGTLTPEFFSLDIRKAFNTNIIRDWDTDLKKLRNHGSYILEGIRSDIGGESIKRTDSFSQLLEISERDEFVFLKGERGCGKSSLAREFFDYLKDRAPIFCLRTEDLDESHLDKVFFKIGLKGTLDDIEAGFALMPKRYLLIESFEKLLELQHISAFNDLINFIHKHSGWTIIATGRSYAFQQIVFNYLQPSGVQFSYLEIGGFSDNDIQYLSDKLKPLKPFVENQEIKQLLMIPFYADLAYRVAINGTQLSSMAGELEFRNAVWRAVISKEHVRKSGMPLKRKQTFISIAVKRAKCMVYSVPENEYESEVLLNLEDDNLIRRDKSKGLVNLAHDVLEDWALERYIEDAFQKNIDSIQDFFNALGPEPAMNRAFRLWLHQKLRCGQGISGFILKLLGDKTIARSWHDEAISAILLGDNPCEFLFSLKDQLFANESELLKRFFFILRIACKLSDRNLVRKFFIKKEKSPDMLEPLILKPYGRGWESIIQFLFENKEFIKDEISTHLTAVLDEWCSVIHIDQELPPMAHEVGIIALHLLSPLKNKYRDNENIKKLLGVIIQVSPSILKEFHELLEKDVWIQDKSRSSPAYVDELVSMSLMGIETVFLCKHMPDVVIRLAWQEWLIPEIKQDYDPPYVEKYFGLQWYRFGSKFSPASGAKGPFSHLLRFHPRKGLDFILELCNKTAEKYANSDLDSPRRYSTDSPINPKSKEDKQIEIQLADGAVLKQYCSGRLWEGYRGHSGLPALLQSALMALENWLIDFIEHTKTVENIEWIFNHILRNSNSVMTTAVLASVATGFPDKIGKTTFPILRTPELYHLDVSRCNHERGEYETDWHKTGYRHDPFTELYSEEKRKAALRLWRKENLEDLIMRLQFTDLREDVFAILDDLRSCVPCDDEWRIRFHQIDSRSWKPEADIENKRIIFKPKNIEPDLQEIQQEAQEFQVILSRFSALSVWSEKTLRNESLDRDYYETWESAFKETKSLLDILLDSGSSIDLSSLYFGAIVKAASIFLRDYSSELEEKDAFWCIELVVQALKEDANKGKIIETEDILDQRGVAAAGLVLPILLDYAQNDEERIDVKRLIATALTHSDYNVRKETSNGIREHLWQRDSNFAQKCIEGTIEYARLYLDEINRKRRTNGTWFIGAEEKSVKTDKSARWLDSFREQFARGKFKVAPVDISFSSHSSKHILCSFLMIPDGSTEPSHMSLWSNALSILIEAEREEIEIHHESPLNFAERFACYLLSISESDWTKFIEQLQDACECSPNFVHWVFLHIALSAERLKQEELYWKFWKHFSEKVQKIAISLILIPTQTRRYDKRTKLIRGMLHADIPRQKVDYENQSIIYGKDLIFQFAENAGANPDIFESLASLMYHFPAIFLSQGLILLSKHQEIVGGTQLLSGVNTVFYLERCIQRFLLRDSVGPISKEMHKSCRVLLEAVIDTSSSVAYYLREHLIRSRKVFD